MTNVVERTSYIVMPSNCKELDCEEMCYVEGGLSLSNAGLYLSYDDIICVTAFVGLNAYALATCLAAATSWICASPIGAIIWGLFAVSGVYLAIQAISAVSQNKGLMISIEWAKVWFLKIPCGLNFNVQ